MSPMGRRIDPAAEQCPSGSQIRLPDCPDFNIDLGYNSLEESFQHNIHNHAQSLLSTPNSPTSFSFSPVLSTGTRDMYCGGSSYGTDMTSLIGSWDSSSVGSFNETTKPASSVEDKGKNVVRDNVDYHVGIEGTIPFPKDKGKGRAIDLPSSSRLSHSPSFEFDFELSDTDDVRTNADSGCRGSPCDIQDVLFETPIMHLSPAIQSDLHGHDSGLYAGPSSRNGEGMSDIAERLGIPVDSTPISYCLKSPTTPSTFVTPPLNGPSVPARALKYRRSLSSVSLGSIKSSSSRSIASIHSTLTGGHIQGKIRSIGPAGKRLKSSLRMMFSRNANRGSAPLAASEFHRDQGADMKDPANVERPVHTSRAASLQDPNITSDAEFHLHDKGFNTESNQRGHTLESSIISQVTVRPSSMEKTVSSSEDVIQDSTVIAVSDSHAMSEPAASATCADIANSEHSNQIVYEDDEDGHCPASKIEVAKSTNNFDGLPREIQLLVLKTLVEIHEDAHQAAVSSKRADIMWSVTTAGMIPWVGRELGLREVVKFSRVSKYWQALTFDGQIWRSLRLASPSELSPAFLLRLAKHAGSFVQSLDLRGWTHLESVALRELVCSLSFDTVSDGLPGGLQSAVSLTTPSLAPTSLTNISLRACSALTAHSLHHILIRAPGLRSVDLHGVAAVTNSTCGVLSTYCPNLECVNLGRCSNLDGHGLCKLINGVSSSRSWANADGTSSVIVPRAFKASRGLYSKLKALKISGIKGLDADVLAVLAAGAPWLEVLDISYSRDLTDDAISAFVAWDNGWETPSTMRDDEPMPYLRKVRLTSRQMGRDPVADIGPFYKRVTHLRHLNLSSCSLLTDRACAHLAHCVPDLEFFELAGIGPDLGDEGLVRLFNTTPRIRRVDLENASEITDAVIDSLTPKVVAEATTRGNVPVSPPSHPGHSLEHLIISYCINITNEALLDLIRACSRLTVLECDNTRVSATVIKSFVNTMRSRGILGAEIVAVDCRGIMEALVKDLASQGQTRPRKGYRHYDARTLGYVDSRDDEDFSNLSGSTVIDDCDDRRVTLKSFWSWQAVDMVQQTRERWRKMGMTRKHSDSGSDLGSFQRDNAGRFARQRWLGQWPRGSATYLPSSTDGRACVLM